MKTKTTKSTESSSSSLLWNEISSLWNEYFPGGDGGSQKQQQQQQQQQRRRRQENHNKKKKKKKKLEDSSSWNTMMQDVTSTTQDVWDTIQSQLLGSISSYHERPELEIMGNNASMIAVLFVLALIYVIWRLLFCFNNNNNNKGKKKHPRNNKKPRNNPAIGLVKTLSGRNTHNKSPSNGMEILRAARRRASTFDFFGMMHHKTTTTTTTTTTPQKRKKRGRKQKQPPLVDEDHNTIGDWSYKRERMGSMDLFLSGHVNHHHAKKKMQKKVVPNNKNKTNVTAPKRRRVRLPSSDEDYAFDGTDVSKASSTNDYNIRKPRGRRYSKDTTDLTLDNTNDNNDNPNIMGEEEEDDDGYLYDEFGLVTLSYQVVYYGPSHTSMTYHTWTPPTSWAEASRRIIIPQNDIMLKLERVISLDIAKGQLLVQEKDRSSTSNMEQQHNSGKQKWDIALSTQDISLHVKPPVHGGVLQLYFKGDATTSTTSAAAAAATPNDVMSIKDLHYTSKKNIKKVQALKTKQQKAAAVAAGAKDNHHHQNKSNQSSFWLFQQEQQEQQQQQWMEHTFDSAHAAAQFQLDLLAHQVLGKTLLSIFEALSMVHRGSLASSEPELVLHHDTLHKNNNNANHDSLTTDVAGGEPTAETTTAGNTATTATTTQDNTGTSTNQADGKSNNNNKKKGSNSMAAAVAWDDAMRALSSIPTIRIALERLWLTKRRPISDDLVLATAAPTTPASSNNNTNTRKTKGGNTTTADTATASNNNNDNDEGAWLLTEEYKQQKRLLLGPVDFFRLFVPALPESAIPQTESNRSRMEQLLSWRKRAARAALLVQQYMSARCIVNRGWQLFATDKDNHDHRYVNRPTEQLRKRLAYDDNEDNQRHDQHVKNEYYEASVSRDVLCYVRPFDYFFHHAAEEKTKTKTKELVLSPFQAYSLVGMHVFELDANVYSNPKHPLHPSQDPIMAFPSLYQILLEHPHLDFFVLSLNQENNMMIQLYVRSLPKGIDPPLDTVLERFTQSSKKEERDSRVNVMLQFCDNSGVSLASSWVFRIMSFLMGLTRQGRETPWAWEARQDRITIPAFRIADYAETHHFGGAMSSSSSSSSSSSRPSTAADEDGSGLLPVNSNNRMFSPKNYLAMSCDFNVINTYNAFFKFLYNRVRGSRGKNIVDVTIVLQGQQEDELPERALFTNRTVQIDVKAVAEKGDQHIVEASLIQSSDDPLTTGAKRVGTTALYLGDKISDVAIHAVNVISAPLQHVLHYGSPREASLLSADAWDTWRMNSGSPTSEFSHRLSTTVEAMEMAVWEVRKAVDSVVVPMRKEYLLFNPRFRRLTERDDFWRNNSQEEMVPVEVLAATDDFEIERFLEATRYDVKKTSVRLVETVAWRGRTFPVDSRKCRIELHNGQFFQQGYDKQQNPVFYFRNMCLGPWRRDVDAVISAILYRFHSIISKLSEIKPNVKCTLIILMGRPFSRTDAQKCKDDDDTKSHAETTIAGAGAASTEEQANNNNISFEDVSMVDARSVTNAGYNHHLYNPRISDDETWQKHTNRDLIHKLFELFQAHYPERLATVCVVLGKGKNAYFTNTKVSANAFIRKVVGSNNTVMQSKLHVIANPSKLTRYVDDHQLVSLVGGLAPIHPDVFQSR